MHPVSGYMLVLNEAPFIRYSIASLLPQVDELLVMDCGSTDETVSLVKEFCLLYPKVRLVEAPQKGGRYSAEWDEPSRRNYCLGRLAHDWVLTIDGDEYLDAEPQLFRFCDYPIKLDVVNLVPGRRHIVFAQEGETRRRFSPDYHVRFFNAAQSYYSPEPLHCQVIDQDGVVEGSYGPGTIWHYNAFYKLRGVMLETEPERFELADLTAVPPLEF